MKSALSSECICGIKLTIKAKVGVLITALLRQVVSRDSGEGADQLSRTWRLDKHWYRRKRNQQGTRAEFQKNDDAVTSTE